MLLATSNDWRISGMAGRKLSASIELSHAFPLTKRIKLRVSSHGGQLRNITRNIDRHTSIETQFTPSLAPLIPLYPSQRLLRVRALLPSVWNPWRAAIWTSRRAAQQLSQNFWIKETPPPGSRTVILHFLFYLLMVVLFTRRFISSNEVSQRLKLPN